MHVKTHIAFFLTFAQVQEYRAELDVCLPAPLNRLGQWLQHMEAVLSDESDTKDHVRAARDARNKQERLKVSTGIFHVEMYIIEMIFIILITSGFS